jgi:hypothetical protein
MGRIWMVGGCGGAGRLEKRKEGGVNGKVFFFFL